MTTTNALERFQSFQENLAERKLEFHQEWVADGDYEEEGGYKAALKILSASGAIPSAILLRQRPVAIGAVRALKEAEVSVHTRDMSTRRVPTTWKRRSTTAAP